jgi:hypothetical protein
MKRIHFIGNHLGIVNAKTGCDTKVRFPKSLPGGGTDALKQVTDLKPGHQA